MGIESIVDDNSQKASGDLRDGMCSTCEMTVVWMQNQLKQNQTQDRILNYVNEVKYPLLSSLSFSFFWFPICCSLCLLIVSSNCSSVTGCLVQWENQQLIVPVCLQCLMFPLQLVEGFSTSALKRCDMVY